jgi:large repetitive protein
MKSKLYSLIIALTWATFSFGQSEPLIDTIIYGYVIKENNTPINGVQIFSTSIFGSNNNNGPSDSAGLFSLNLQNEPVNSITQLIAGLNNNPNNGVTVYDLFLIQKHLLGLQNIPTPYRLIAADANKSNTITDFDILELQKLILGIYNDLPNNTSWRFININQIFENPSNPFIQTVWEAITVQEAIQLNNDTMLIGVKIGDINLNATTGSQTDPEVNSGDQLVIKLETTKLNVVPNDIIEITVKPEAPIMHQYTLALDEFDVLEVIPIANANYNVFPGAVNSKLTACNLNTESVYKIKLLALTDGAVCDKVNFTNEITPTLAYNESGERIQIIKTCDLVSSIDNPTPANMLTVLPNTPNTWSDKTTINFHLPTDDHITLQIFNISGQLLYRTEGDYSKGLNQIPIEAAQVGNTSGQMHYVMSSSNSSVTKSMIRINK